MASKKTNAKTAKLEENLASLPAQLQKAADELEPVKKIAMAEISAYMERVGSGQEPIGDRWPEMRKCLNKITSADDWLEGARKKVRWATEPAVLERIELAKFHCERFIAHSRGEKSPGSPRHRLAMSILKREIKGDKPNGT